MTKSSKKKTRKVLFENAASTAKIRGKELNFRISEREIFLVIPSSVDEFSYRRSQPLLHNSVDEPRLKMFSRLETPNSFGLICLSRRVNIE